MSIEKIQFSIGVLDADGSPKSTVIYGVYDSASVTLNDLLAWMRITAGYFDSITDAKLVSINAQMNVSLPLGLKAAAVVGSNVEETGLLSFALNGLEGRSYGQDIPAIKQALLSGKTINQAATEMATWITRMITGSTISPTEDKYTYFLTTPLRKAVKTFRR
jgi:hypothetical protein